MLTFIFHSTCCPGVFWVFQFLGRAFQLKVLPFGLKVFPWVFTRVVATLVHCRSSSPVRSSSVLLFGRLASGGGVQGSFGVLLRTTLLWSRDLGFLVNWVKFFLHSTETSVLSWGSFRHPKVVGSAFRAQSFGSSGVFQDLSKGPLAPALFWQKFFGHLAGFVDLVLYCRLLMRPLQLHLLRDFTPLIDSQDLLVPLSSDFKVLCVAWSSPSRLLEGKLFAALPPSLVITTDASGQGWGGGSSSPSPCVRGLVEGGGLWSYQYSGIEGSSSSSTEPRISCGGSFASDLFKLHDGGIVHHFSGGILSLSPVSAGLGPVGMVSSEENFSSRGSHSRRRVLCGGFSLQGLIPSYSVSSESCRFSADLSYVFFPFGVRFVRVSFQFPAPEVLLSLPGCSGVEYRRSVVSLVGFSTLRVFPFSLLLRILGQVSPGRSRPSLGSFRLASEGLGFLVSWGSWWAFRGCCQSWKTWWYNPCLCFRISRLKVFIFLYGPLSGNKMRRQAFHRELRSSQLRPFRQSTRDTFDSRLGPFPGVVL